MDKRTSVAMAGILIGVIMALLIMDNYRTLRDGLVSNEQEYLLTLAESTAKSIESYLSAEEKSIKQLSQDYQFIRDFYEAVDGAAGNLSDSSVAVYYNLESPGISLIELLDTEGHIKALYPYKGEEHVSNQVLEEDVVRLNREIDGFYDQVFYEGKVPFIHLIQPVFKDGRCIGALRIKMNINHIYDLFVADIRSGSKGYASVKDSKGTFLMHPNDNQIGYDALTLRKTEYPDFDWSELEALFEKQRQRQSGVEIYHSVWVTEEAPERVQKFNGYAPVTVGDDFWIVTVSADYNEVVDIIKDNYYRTVIIAALIFMIIFSSFIFLYISRQREERLMLQMQHLEEVKSLNIELEEDIEKRKVLEKELTRTGNKYETLFNSNEDVILLVECSEAGDALVIEANAKASSMLGYDKQELLSMRLHNIDPRIEDVILQTESDMETSEQGDSTYESMWMKKGGSLTPMEVRISTLELEDRRMLLLVSRDITRRRMEEEAVRRSEQRFIHIVSQLTSDDGTYESNLVDPAEEAGPRINARKLETINRQLEEMFKKEMDENKRKEALMMHQSRYVAMGEMIGNIAHQWRQPLNALSVMLSNFEDMVLEEEYDQDYLRKMFVKSRKLISKMSMTIDDFRYFFKPRTHKSAFNVFDSITTTASLCEERIRFNNVELNMDGDRDLTIIGYSNQLSQVVLNLINNAIDAFQDSEVVHRRIQIQVVNEGDACVVAFKDNAGGIPEAVMEQIFDPYFTTKEMKNGTGLGLYMSRMIIEKNFDGSIEVANTDGGALFKMTLAFGKEEDSDDQSIADVL